MIIAGAQHIGAYNNVSAGTGITVGNKISGKYSEIT